MAAASKHPRPQGPEASELRPIPGPGAMRVPVEWQAETMIRLAEPLESGIAAPLALKEVNARPRAHIRVIRAAPAEGHAESALEAMMAELRSTAPAAKELGRGTLVFDDGTQGPFVTLRVEVGPGLRALQLHAFRVDRGTLTHLTASVSDRDAEKLDNLTTIVKSFRPSLETHS